MPCCLDTNVCIALINGRPEHVRQRLAQEIAVGGAIFVSFIVAFELWCGWTERTEEANRRRVQAFFAGLLSIVEFGDADAQVAGHLRASLERAGTPIGAYDVLIAAQALRLRARLITANVREFARVEGLAWEDWA